MTAVGGGVVSEAANAVGLWWPAADEERLRAAASAWDGLATALDGAGDDVRAVPTRLTPAWQGSAAAAAVDAGRCRAQSLADQAAGARRTADALRRYADAVGAAKRRVEELAAEVGASLVGGAVLGLFTFGTAEAAAAAVSAGLVAAAEAVGVELTATAAAIGGTTLTGAAFGAGEAAVVDMVVTQPVREVFFHDGGFSWSEVGGAATSGAVGGGVLGGIGGALAAGPIARTAAGDRSLLYAPGGRIRAAVDPENWGAQGRAFRPGVHETPGARLLEPHERITADLMTSEVDGSAHVCTPVNAQGVKTPDVLFRHGPDDPGTYVELKRPTSPTVNAVAAAVRLASRQLRQVGGGDLVIEGRPANLPADVAQEGLDQAIREAGHHGRQLPDHIRIVLGDGTSIHHP